MSHLSLAIAFYSFLLPSKSILQRFLSGSITNKLSLSSGRSFLDHCPFAPFPGGFPAILCTARHTSSFSLLSGCRFARSGLSESFSIYTPLRHLPGYFFCFHSSVTASIGDNNGISGEQCTGGILHIRITATNAFQFIAVAPISSHRLFHRRFYRTVSTHSPCTRYTNAFVTMSGLRRPAVRYISLSFQVTCDGIPKKKFGSQEWISVILKIYIPFETLPSYMLYVTYQFFIAFYELLKG